MTTSTADIEHEFLSTARRALRASGDDARVDVALDTLGWWDLLAQLDDPEPRTAAFALFRAQGRELASSPALGGLLAQPYVEATGETPGSIVAAVARRATHRGPVQIVVGDLGGRRLLIDRPGHGAWIADAGDVGLRRLDLPGRLVLHQVEGVEARWRQSIGEEHAAEARRHSTYLGRTALALEVLGAAEALVDLAVEHAGSREQFGTPIGTFQAVRHLLAGAGTDCMALDGVTRQAVAFGRAAPPMYGEVVKALAGRNGRRACEHTLQVFGAIGFTAEHDHHHFHSRVLALDALLGTSAELTHDLGARLRATGTDPGFAAAALRTSHESTR